MPNALLHRVGLERHPAWLHRSARLTNRAHALPERADLRRVAHRTGAERDALCFNSIEFAVVMPTVYELYRAMSPSVQTRLLLVASYIFYVSW